MDDCIFCKIIKGEIPSTKVYEDETMLAFRDINPQAPTHIIIVPKRHIASANEVTEENSHLVAHIFTKIPIIAKQEGIDKYGYRIINNCGKDGGQTVFHLHFHIIGGRELTIKMA